jgi:hypothetical protein
MLDALFMVDFSTLSLKIHFIPKHAGSKLLGEVVGSTFGCIIGFAGPPKYQAYPELLTEAGVYH